MSERARALSARDVARRCESLRVDVHQFELMLRAVATVEVRCNECGTPPKFYFAAKQMPVGRALSGEAMAGMVAEVVTEVLLHNEPSPSLPTSITYSESRAHS